MDKTRRGQDIEDYNIENSGQDVGRINRFSSRAQLLELQAKEDKDDLNFELLMQVERERMRREFEEQQQALFDDLEELDRASLLALQQAEEDLQRVRDNANRAKDGRRIYLNEADGQVYDEDGNLVGAQEIDLDKWDSSNSTFGEYDIANQKVELRGEQRDEALKLKVQAEDAKDAEELNSVREHVEDLEHRMTSPSGSEWSARSTIQNITPIRAQKGSLLSTSILQEMRRRSAAGINGRDGRWAK